MYFRLYATDFKRLSRLIFKTIQEECLILISVTYKETSKQRNQNISESFHKHVRQAKIGAYSYSVWAIQEERGPEGRHWSIYNSLSSSKFHLDKQFHL